MSISTRDAEPFVASAGQASRGLDVDDRHDLAEALDQRLQAVVLVLIDQHHFEVAVGLQRKRPQQPLERRRSINGAYDEAEHPSHAMAAAVRDREL